MMSRRAKSDSHDMPGQDSFLDIVANLIGVLIILVVVVGANAGSTLQSVARKKQADSSDVQALQEGTQTICSHGAQLATPQR